MRLSILELFASVADRILAWSAGFTVNLIQQRLRLQTAQLQREQLEEADRLEKDGYSELASQLRQEALDMGTRPGTGSHSMIDELLGNSQPRLESTANNDRLPSVEDHHPPIRKRGRPPRRHTAQQLPSDPAE